jgi:hypothetical protein
MAATHLGGLEHEQHRATDSHQSGPELRQDQSPTSEMPVETSIRQTVRDADERPTMSHANFVTLWLALFTLVVAVLLGAVSLAHDLVVLGIVAVGVALAGAVMILGASIAARRSERPRAHSESAS